MTVRDRVRWSDVDAAGIVCFGKYLRFFELAETELFHRAGLPVSVLLEQHQIWFVRRHVECDFLRPLRLDEDVRVSAHVESIGKSSVQLCFLVEVPHRHEVIASGRYILVAVEREALEKRPLPSAVRSALEPFRLASAAEDEPGNRSPVPEHFVA